GWALGPQQRKILATEFLQNCASWGARLENLIMYQSNFGENRFLIMIRNMF
ncbi:hypothetical protein SS7213T_04901, partial [Staphylococcus simiae CCM 7213 = CCUG 51256]